MERSDDFLRESGLLEGRDGDYRYDFGSGKKEPATLDDAFL